MKGYRDRAGRARDASLHFVSSGARGTQPTAPNGKRVVVWGAGGFQHARGVRFVEACGMRLYLYVASKTTQSQKEGGSFEWRRAHRTDSMGDMLKRSAIALDWG